MGFPVNLIVNAVVSGSTGGTPKHWTIYLEEKNYEAAVEQLKQNHRIGADAFLLHHCIKHSMPIESIREVLAERWASLSPSNYYNGMVMAIRKGDQDRYTFLFSEFGISSAQKNKLIIEGLIDAATGQISFVKRFLENFRAFKKYIKTTYGPNRMDEIPDEDKEFLKFCDLSQRRSSPTRAFLWDDISKELTARGTKSHSLPLHAAVDCNCTDIVTLLLQNGADPAALDHDNDTALTIAQRNKFTEMSKMLNIFSVLKNTLHTHDDSKSPIRRVELIKLYHAFASCYIKDADGNTLLHQAVKGNDQELAQVLLKFEPALQVEPNNKGELPELTKLGIPTS